MGARSLEFRPLGIIGAVLPFLVFALLLPARTASSQQPDQITFSDYSSDNGDYSTPTPVSAVESSLANFTRGLLEQKLGVFGQGMRIENGRFASHRCQVVYLGNPDWTNLKLDVRFVDGSLTTCPLGQQPRAVFAYVDGYEVPKLLSSVTFASTKTPWVAVISKTGSAELFDTTDGGGSTPPPSTAAPPPTLPSEPEPQDGGQVGEQPSGILGRLRRRLMQLSIGGSFTGIRLSNGRQTFQDAYADLREKAVATKALLDGGDSAVPGPGGPLTLPVLVSDRIPGAVASQSSYEQGALVEVVDEHGGDPLANSKVLSDLARVYWAPEADCQLVMGADGSHTARNGAGVDEQDSCYATQLVVYVYNPCVNATRRAEYTTNSSTGDGGVPTSTPTANVTANGTHSGAPFQERLVDMLEAELTRQAAEQSINESLGYVQVLVSYTPYTRCVRPGVDTLSDVSVQVMLFSALIFGWLLLFLMLPSFYRLFLEFPFRLLVHGVRKLLGKDDKLKPMKPGLHSRNARRTWRLHRHLEAVVMPVLRLRKYLLYAVITVHYSDGQSRWLQVSVISTVSLCIAMAVYAPGIAPPLSHFVPPLALQITRTGTQVAALQYFFDIVVFSSFMGTLGYLSMLANYNSPTNRYYRVQCVLSAFFMLLQDLLAVLQLTSTLAQWDYLDPAWPYLPLVVFQIINLLVANVLQVVIFSKRHDLHNRAVYDAYVASKAVNTATGAEARKADVAERASHEGRSSRSSHASTAEERDVGVALDGESSSHWQSHLRGPDGGGGGGGGGYINIKRHRQRAAQEQHGRQQPRPHQRHHHTAHPATERKPRGRADSNDDDDEAHSARAPEPPADAQSASEPLPPPLAPARAPRQGSRRRTAAAEREAQGTPAAAPVATSASPGAAGGTGSPVRPRRRLLDGGAGPLAEGLEEDSGGGSGSEDSDFGSRARARLLGGRGEGKGKGAVKEAAARSGVARRLLSASLERSGGGEEGTRHPAAVELVRYGSGRSGLRAGGGGAANGGDTDGLLSGTETETARRLFGGGQAGVDEHAGVPYYKRPYNGQRLHGAAEASVSAVKAKDVSGKPGRSSREGSRRPAAGTPAPASGSKTPSLKLKARKPLTAKPPQRRTAATTTSTAAAIAAVNGYGSDSDGSSTDTSLGGSSYMSEGPGGWRGVLLLPAAMMRRVWRRLQEGQGFRYPAWLLAALLVSGYMVVFHYARALEWSSALSDCLMDPGTCATNTLGRYFKFVSRVLSQQQQQQLRDSLDRLVGTRDHLLSYLATEMGVGGTNANANATLYQFNKTELMEELWPNISTSINSTVESMSGAIAKSLVESGLGDANETAAAVASITPNISAVIQSQLNDAFSRLLDRANSSGVSSGRQKRAAFSAMNSTVFTLYDTINLTSRIITRGIQIQDEVHDWRKGLTERFKWSSVLGFTLGLMLGMSTLVQTAISFRRAVRQARRMRVARQVFDRLFNRNNDMASIPGANLLIGGESSLIANRAQKTSVSLVVFFFGVLMSTAVIQLYMVGVLLSVFLAFLTHPWTWTYLMPRTWLYLVAIAAVFVLNKYVLIGYVGDAFLSNGNHIYRPAAWLAFTFIMSITNLVIGLLLAVYRIVLLLLTTVLSLGKLEVTIFTFFSNLDLPHQSFLAGLHMHEAMSNFHDPIYLPGPRGAAHRRWRKLRDTVRRLQPEELRLLATLGRPKQVQDCLDHVVVDMQAAKMLATGSRPLDAGSKPLAAGSRTGPGMSRLTSTSGVVEGSVSGGKALQGMATERRAGRGRGAITQATAAVSGRNDDVLLSSRQQSDWREPRRPGQQQRRGGDPPGRRSIALDSRASAAGQPRSGGGPNDEHLMYNNVTYHGSRTGGRGRRNNDTWLSEEEEDRAAAGAGARRGGGGAGYHDDDEGEGEAGSSEAPGLDASEEAAGGRRGARRGRQQQAAAGTGQRSGGAAGRPRSELM